MLLALNYSPEAAALLRAGRIEIDRFKCPPWPDMIAEAGALRPVCVHFELRAGRGALANANWDMVAAFMERHDTPYCNLHLAPRPDEFPGVPVGSGDPAHVELVAAALLEDVLRAVERFGPERVIVENIPYRGPSGRYLRASVEPATIRRIVEESGCGLLLDISHARIAARSLGVDERAYIEQLPVERVRELHITGLGYEQGELRDHLAMREEDWPPVAWAIERIRGGAWGRPWLAAVEYGGIGPIFEWRSDPAVMLADVPRIYALVKGQRPGEGQALP